MNLKNILALPPRPSLTLLDVELLPLVKLALRSDVCGYQAGKLACIERGSARRIIETYRHNSPLDPLSRFSAISPT